MWATSVIFGKKAQSKQSPFGENSPNLATLLFNDIYNLQDAPNHRSNAYLPFEAM
jgi:hypothetical protein